MLGLREVHCLTHYPTPDTKYIRLSKHSIHDQWINVTFSRRELYQIHTKLSVRPFMWENVLQLKYMSTFDVNATISNILFQNIFIRVNKHELVTENGWFSMLGLRELKCLTLYPTPDTKYIPLPTAPFISNNKSLISSQRAHQIQTSLGPLTQKAITAIQCQYLNLNSDLFSCVNDEINYFGLNSDLTVFSDFTI